MAASMMRFACRSRFIVPKLNPTCTEHHRKWHDHLTESVPYRQHPEESLDRKYPEVEICSEDYQFVERLLPSETVPPPPQHEQYPTPSGWFPPDASKQPSEYKIQRTRNHMLPVYMETFKSGRVCTTIKNIHGDIWKLDTSVREAVAIRLSQVHEVGRFIRFKGDHVEAVAKLLLDKGF